MIEQEARHLGGKRRGFNLNSRAPACVSPLGLSLIVRQPTTMGDGGWSSRCEGKGRERGTMSCYLSYAIAGIILSLSPSTSVSPAAAVAIVVSFVL